MPEEQQLLEIRKQIDSLDQELQALINRRAKLAQEVARIKQANGQQTVYYRPEREAELLLNIKQRNDGPLADEEITRLFREIMSACLALENALDIGFLGPEGTFTQSAALKHFGHSVKTTPLATINEIFREVESGNLDYGVVPVENSTEGVINHTLDMFIHSSLKISGEVELRIHHHLLSQQMDKLKITRVYSHQQSLAQCRGWLDTYMPEVERVAVSSNAEAAKRVIQDADFAAIAGETAAEIYQLPFVARNIEDDPDNTTRFLIIGRHDVPPSGRDKTSLLLSASNQVGTLYHLLEPFVSHKISMNRIESRPSRRGMWDYVFFIDINGHKNEAKVKAALSDLGQKAMSVKILGSYPCAVL